MTNNEKVINIYGGYWKNDFNLLGGKRHMSKTIKRVVALILGVLLTVTALPMEHILVLAASANYVKSLPKEDKNWAYVGGEYFKSKNTGSIWIRGNAYNKTGFELNDKVDTTSSMYKEAYDTLQQNQDLKDVKICILYIPNCPYSKSFLPKYQMIAGEVQAKVLLIDVMTYQTASLLPFYNSVNQGVVSPTVLYIKKDGTLAGQTKVHSTADFVEILKEAGYDNAKDVTDASTDVYTSEQAYEEEVIKETNRQRIANGLLPLATYEPLNKAADTRVKELLELEKIAHQRPNGDYYNTVFQEFGVDSSKYYTGENIAAGAAYATPKSAVNGWMGSTGHRANILYSYFNLIGVGYYSTSDSSSTYGDYWIQLFMGNEYVEFESMTLSQQSISVAKGVPISDMNLVATLKFKGSDEVATLPIIDEMVIGYNKSQSGEQRVTVKYGDLTAELDITVGTVDPVQLTDDMVTLTQTQVEYDGTAKTPSVSVSNATGTYALLEGYSYAVEYSNNINAGTATLTVTGKGNYKGTVTKTFTIAPKDISGGSINGIQDTYEYTGKEITPAVSVTLGGKQLYETKDFTVEYANHKGTIQESSSYPATVTGTATITVTGKGNYTGTLTKTFGFTISDTFKYAAQVALVLDPTKYYNSIYDKMVNLYTNHHDTAYPNVLTMIQNVLTKADTALKTEDEPEGTGLNRIMTYNLYSVANERLVDFYRFYNEYELGIKADDIIKAPEVTTSVIKKDSVSLKGLENSLTEDSKEAQLSISDFTEDVAIDPKLYDVVNPVVLDIDLTIDGEKAKLDSPVTITMKIPDSLKDVDNLVVLHYKDGANKEPEELATFVNGDGTFSFVTSSFSPYVLTNKIEQYDVDQAGVVENDPNMSFGELQLPNAVEDKYVVAYRSAEKTISVSWKQVSGDNTWNVLGYMVSYSKHEDMSNAHTVEVGKYINSVTLEDVEPGEYYITVSTVASPLSSLWTVKAVNQSQRKKVKIPESDNNVTETPDVDDTTKPGDTTTKPDDTTTKPGDTTTKPNDTTTKPGDTTTKPNDTTTKPEESKPQYYSINWNKVENGTIQANTVRAKEGESVKVTVTANSGYELSLLKVVTTSNKELVVKTVSDTMYEFTMPNTDVTILAEFKETETSDDSNKDLQQVVVSPTENGSVSLNTTEAKVGERVTATISARVGYQLKSIRILNKNGEEVKILVSSSDRYVFEMPEGGVTIQVEFEKQIESSGQGNGQGGDQGGNQDDTQGGSQGENQQKPSKVEVIKAENGYIVVSKESANVGEEVTVTVQAKEGYELKSFYILDQFGKQIPIVSADNGRYVFEMPEGEVKIQAEFVEKIVVDNSQKVEDSSSADSSAQDNTDAQGNPVGTGDSTHIVLPVTMVIVSLCVILSFVFMKKKDHLRR